ncbi:hypothetical protein D3C80_1302360 [compost metagenome]
MSKEGAGGIEFLTVQQQSAIPLGKMRLVINRGFGTDFGEGIAQPVSFENTLEIVPLLLFAARKPQRLDHIEVILRNLPDATIGCGNERRHFRQRRRRNASATIFFRHGNGPQAALRKALYFGKRQAPLPVAFGGTGSKGKRQLPGNGNRLRIVLYDVSLRPARRNMRRRLSRGQRGLAMQLPIGRCHRGDLSSRRGAADAHRSDNNFPHGNTSTAPDRAVCERGHCASAGPAHVRQAWNGCPQVRTVCSLPEWQFRW